MSTKIIGQLLSVSSIYFFLDNFQLFLSVRKTAPDITGNSKKDIYILHLSFANALPDTVVWEDIYQCVNYAKPVTIPMEASDIAAYGLDPSCDYTSCVGEEIKVGY